MSAHSAAKLAYHNSWHVIALRLQVTTAIYTVASLPPRSQNEGSEIYHEHLQGQQAQIRPLRE